MDLAKGDPSHCLLNSSEHVITVLLLHKFQKTVQRVRRPNTKWCYSTHRKIRIKNFNNKRIWYGLRRKRAECLCFSGVLKDLILFWGSLYQAFEIYASSKLCSNAQLSQSTSPDFLAAHQNSCNHSWRSFAWPISDKQRMEYLKYFSPLFVPFFAGLLFCSQRLNCWPLTFKASFPPSHERFFTVCSIGISPYPPEQKPCLCSSGLGTESLHQRKLLVLTLHNDDIVRPLERLASQCLDFHPTSQQRENPVKHSTEN